MRRDGRVCVWGYARVSGSEQGRTGTSLGAQQDEIRRWCKARGHPRPTIRIEVESAAAEKIERRVVLQGLIDEVRPGDIIMVTRLDRWSRDIVQAVQSVRDLVKRGIGWVAIGDGIDASTAQGDSTLGIMSWVADQERRRIYERTVLRRKALRDEGRYVEGLPPIGYRRGEGNILEPTGDAEAIRDLYRFCSRGASLREVAARARERWGIKRDKQVWHKALRNRVYLGEVQTSGGEWMAAHEPVVDRVLWAAVQDSLRSGRLSGPRPSESARTDSWLLRGLAVCGDCGGHMGAAYGGSRRPGVDGHGYYACANKLRRRSCSAPYVRVDAADDAAGRMAIERLADLRVELAGVAPKPESAPDFDRERRRIAKRRERLLDAVEAGAIQREALVARSARIESELLAIDRREAAHRARVAVADPSARRALLADVRSTSKRWRLASVRDRREIVRRLAARIELSAGCDPVIEWRTLAELADG